MTGALKQKREKIEQDTNKLVQSLRRLENWINDHYMDWWYETVSLLMLAFDDVDVDSREFHQALEVLQQRGVQMLQQKMQHVSELLSKAKVLNGNVALVLPTGDNTFIAASIAEQVHELTEFFSVAASIKDK